MGQPASHCSGDQTEAAGRPSNGPSLQPLRDAVARLGRGRPRKLPPVPVPADMKYCFACRSVLPLASFATDRQQPDGKKLDCRACDNVARVARRRARLKLQVAA